MDEDQIEEFNTHQPAHPSKTNAYRVAFKMRLYKGFETEYKRRHSNIWPRLQDLLKTNGISEYSIFLDEATNDLFAIMKVENPASLNNMSQHPVMKEWWSYMKDIMDTNEDDSPLSTTLEEVFYLP